MAGGSLSPARVARMRMVKETFSESDGAVIYTRWNTVVECKQAPRRATPASMVRRACTAARAARRLAPPPAPTSSPSRRRRRHRRARRRDGTRCVAPDAACRGKFRQKKGGGKMSLYLRRLGGLAPLVAVALRCLPLSAPAEAPRAAGPLDRRHPGAQRRGERLALGAAGHLQLALHACTQRQQSSRL